MKIGTISLNFNAPDFNYGALLHSWAFQQYLKKLPYVKYTEILDYTIPKLEGQNLKYPIREALFGCHLKKLLYHIKNHGMYQSRFKKFEKFITKNICKSETRYIQTTLDESVLDYDCIICESDVIWAPGFFGGHFDKSFFLASKSMRNMRRIAYAPSMADGDLNDDQEDEIRDLLRYPDMISCRESYEKIILEKYTSKPVVHVLDPVMLLNAEEYSQICADRIFSDRYLLLYLPVDDNTRLREYAGEFAQKKGLKILEISTKLKNYKKDNLKCIGNAGIEEFLSAIKYADFVFTNSFHAICFSVLFNVQFYAFSRTNSGKVEDICKTFGLSERYFADNNFAEGKIIDYSTVNKRYEEMRVFSMQWINSAIRGEDY